MRITAIFSAGTLTIADLYWRHFSRLHFSPLFFRVLNFLRFREIGTHILSMYVLMAQKYSYQFTISTSSPESYDEDLAKGLYDWTMKKITPYK